MIVDFIIFQTDHPEVFRLIRFTSLNKPFRMLLMKQRQLRKRNHPKSTGCQWNGKYGSACSASYERKPYPPSPAEPLTSQTRTGAHITEAPRPDCHRPPRSRRYGMRCFSALPPVRAHRAAAGKVLTDLSHKGPPYTPVPPVTAASSRRHSSEPARSPFYSGRPHWPHGYHFPD